MYDSAWAWAGDTPFRYMELIAGDFGGTRTPMVVSWPGRIAPDRTPRSQFHQVNDLAPTLYEILGLRPPDVVDGHRQPWSADLSALATWDEAQDRWELFDTQTDYSLTRDLATEQPDKLAELQRLFMRVAEEKRTTNTEWTFYGPVTRIPEVEAPNVRSGNLRVEIDAEVPSNANGLLFALGGYSGGVSLFVWNGELRYEYSSLLLRRTKIDVGRLPVGSVRMEMEMRTPHERGISSSRAL